LESSPSRRFWRRPNSSRRRAEASEITLLDCRQLALPGRRCSCSGYLLRASHPAQPDQVLQSVHVHSPHHRHRVQLLGQPSGRGSCTGGIPRSKRSAGPAFSRAWSAMMDQVGRPGRGSAWPSRWGSGWPSRPGISLAVPVGISLAIPAGISSDVLFLHAPDHLPPGGDDRLRPLSRPSEYRVCAGGRGSIW
jgi:hypothetical protein